MGRTLWRINASIVVVSVVVATGGAAAAFTDDAAHPDALSFAGTYKVVFLAFPLEAYGTAADKADLVGRAMTFFGP